MAGFNDPKRISWRWLAFAVALVCHSGAHAETPLSLTVSQELTYDSNILKDNSRKYNDSVSSTGVQLGFNKEYGRQTYKASATAVAKRYKNTKDYDNDGYNLALGASSSLLSNWFASVDLSAVQQQQSPENQGNVRYNETIDSQDAQLVLRYGLFGRWSLSGTYEYSKADYKTVNYYDSSANALRLGVRYSPTDLLYFDWGLRKARTNNPNYPLLGAGDVIIYGDLINRYDFDLTSRWVVTGFSNLTGRIAWTQERHPNDSARNFNGVTGRVAWGYTPGGKMSYNVALVRDTNNAGGSSYREYIELEGLGTASAFGQNKQSRVNTGIVLSANYQATAKISLTSGLTYKRIKEESRSVVPGLEGLGFDSSGQRLSGSYRSMNLGLKYNVLRSTTLGCTVEKYDRSQSLFARDYDGEEVSCNAIFTLD